MPFDVSFLGAFGAGVVSFLSPCVLPLVPPYLCYIAGIGLQDLIHAEEKGLQKQVVARALAFVLGFSTVFVALGASATFVGLALARHFEWLTIIAGVAIILMGLNFLGIFRLSLLSREARIQIDRRPAGFGGAYLMGLAFAFGWTPCVGPVLAAILMVAGGEPSAGRGALLLFAYAMGIGLPFLLAAAATGPFLRWAARFRAHLGAVEKVAGAMLVGTGVLFVTGSMPAIGNWLLQAMPMLGRIG